MTGFSFKTVLFYAAYLCLAARAAPAPVTTLSPVPMPTTTELPDGTTTDAGSAAMITTVAPEEDNPVVPPFQCSTLSISDYRKSVSLLSSGFQLASTYINEMVLTPRDCSPLEARLSILHRVGANEINFSLEEGFAILQAYSKIAYLASQRETVDQAKMQIIHELLNGLITNYYEVLSPDHCSCGSASSDSCVKIPNLPSGLDLESYPASCTPEAYISKTLVEDFPKIMIKFLISPVRGANHSNTLTSCQQWKDNYLSPSSGMAAFTLSC